MNMDWANSDALVVVGIVVAFVILVTLVVLCALVSKVFRMLNGTNASKTATAAQGNSSLTPVVQDGVGDDVVAAISAAIAVMMSSEGNTKPYAIRSIRRAREARPAWNAAGIYENTRPF
jgi:Na+-transporting methylmalonyl-CoA/oxaloacetate decarboxylase gamma subunit